MPAILFGVLAGLVFGTLSVAIMLPLKLENAARANLAAFASRFSIGLVVPLVALPMPMWGIGALAGFLISLSDAIVTRAYVPILVIGTLGGALTGLIGGWIVT